MMTHERDARFILVREVEGSIEVVSEALTLQAAISRLDFRKKNNKPTEYGDEALAVIVTQKDAHHVECLIDRRRCAAELRYQLDPLVLSRLDKPAFNSLVRVLADRDDARKHAEFRADWLLKQRDDRNAAAESRASARKARTNGHKRTGKRGAK